MKAWISESEPCISALKRVDCPRPVPGGQSLLVRVTHAPVNFSDLLMIRDLYQVKPQRPFVPGQEVVGIIEDPGNSAGFRVGERIAGKVMWGSFAEYALVPARMAIKVPHWMRSETAASLPISYMTAVVALRHSAFVTSGDTVLVHAAGGALGLATVEVAAAHGASVLATAGSRRKIAVAKEHGADQGFLYSGEDWVENVKSATGGEGASIIVDPVGGKVTVQSLRCIKRGGALLVAGFASGTIAKIPANLLLLKRARAIGVYWDHDRDREMLSEATAEIMKLLADGKLNPVVDCSYRLEDLPAALAALENRQVAGKLVLAVR